MEASAQEDSEKQRHHLFQPLLVCSDPNIARMIASRLDGSRDLPVVRTLFDAKEWVRRTGDGHVILFYYSDMPEDLLAAEIEGANLLVHPVLIRPGPSRSLATSVLMRVSSSVLPVDFTQDEARTASLAAAAQSSWGQSVWSEPGRTELPVASRPLSILVADDNATNRLVISKILERGGHTARCVVNGEDALNALEGEPFDLVILDVNMPVMTGIEATKLYRFTERQGSRTPIIALTADATPEVVAETLAAGMDACLTKPIQPATLLEVIEEHATSRLAQATCEASVPPASLSDVPSSVLDESLLVELERLGGRDFVLSLVEEFLSDADHLVGELRSAAVSGDSHRFRLEAHGLQSASANVGARAVHEICVSWRKITSADLAGNGEEQVVRLERALELTRTLLKRHVTDAEREEEIVHFAAALPFNEALLTNS